ncbi:ATP-dependent DNA helicase RecG [candidate division WOR-3 bacterium]|uniref:ATP-dependent DNA helicase RecG n=1 Tax=candidate division WOR-3 bacterium TaxID=2052148 RepID=A0A9D5KAD9_UNCW3|nr:ATP-dependent DNA helicase RecG [candidate division WOR-3 bacterium]MBD3365422.1 ATP-dependent DNA helicase RecG [candidate division WOR-3 bacterium]
MGLVLSIRPDTSVQYLKGIGPKRAARLAKLGIRTVEDLLFHLPVRYIDRSNPQPVSAVKIGEETTLITRVQGTNVRRTRKGPLVQVLAGDSSGQITAVWFNRPDLQGTFKPGETLLLSGQVTFYNQPQMVNPFFERLDENPDFFKSPIFAVYPLTEGLGTWEVRRAVARALDDLEGMTETLPRHILDKYEFPDILAALRAVHRPQRMTDVNRGLSRLRYEELFFFEILVGFRRNALEYAAGGQALEVEGSLTEGFLSNLPFQLTGDQKKAIEEITADLSVPRPMHRLLQGDVGSGKTVVALHAMLCAVQSGRQAAMMAPTEILAEQHFAGWQGILAETGARALLLTGSLKGREKEENRKRIAKGAVDMIFGTHALIEENVEFGDLALVVVDEQHRFGVLQRAALSAKGEVTPHVLVMSATPIPRTITLSYYGDLDVSVIKEKPAGRAERTTKLAYDSRSAGVYRWLAERIERGERAYVVCPLIEESEKLEVSSAKETFEELKTFIKPSRMALIHGRMKADQRSLAMQRFRSGEIQVLVSTTVIEVGVDVPQATIMIIRHPERFGLAQLHQLRGRIGRGPRPSRCVLLLPSGLSPQARERLKVFAATEDGFKLAEEDLRVRGPGQIMGTRQHGLPDLRIADLLRDRNTLEAARDDAFSILSEDPRLSGYPRIATTVRRRHSESLRMLGVA